MYLDSAATAHKPRVVIDAARRFLAEQNAPVHRSFYPLGERATAQYESARKIVADFIGARDAGEIVFTRNTTEAINLVAYTLGRTCVRRGDEILVSRMEHHSNFVPWLLLAKEKGARLRIAELTTNGLLDLRDFQRKLSRRTRIVALAHVSNVLGAVNPIGRITRLFRDSSLPRSLASPPIVFVDAAQSAPHLPVNVGELGCDFLAFSGHKLYGPTSVGVLWGRRELLETMPPFLAGGYMISEVSDASVAFNDVPWKFEGGTPDVTGAVGLAAAIRYLRNVGWGSIQRHERVLMRDAMRRFADPKIRRLVAVYGPTNADQRFGVIAFTVRGMHPHDVGSLLSEEGVAVRAGHHCAMPLHVVLGVPATTRISFGLYNDRGDLDRFFSALERRVLPFASKK